MLNDGKAEMGKRKHFSRLKKGECDAKAFLDPLGLVCGAVMPVVSFWSLMSHGTDWMTWSHPLSAQPDLPHRIIVRTKDEVMRKAAISISEEM